MEFYAMSLMCIYPNHLLLYKIKSNKFIYDANTQKKQENQNEIMYWSYLNIVIKNNLGPFIRVLRYGFMIFKTLC